MQMNVVVVDDTPINVTLISHLIAKVPDCKAVTFTDPLVALQWCQSDIPDLLIVDYMMPELDGIEFIRQLRQVEGRTDVPILMVTANNQTSVRHTALEAGANDFLTKPIDKVEFNARVRNMLALRAGQRRLLRHAEDLEERVRIATEGILARERETVIRLSRAAESRDPETGEHIARMSHYSRLIARTLGLSEQQQDILLEAAPMHDIGKIGIPDAILLKPGRLTPDEFELMKCHARIGHDILVGSDSPAMQAGAQIALGHHEKFDGSGYPDGLAGEAIPLLARICSVADVFDALTSERPYKKAWEVSAARQFLIDGMGKHFDPQCVQAMLQSWEEVLAIRERFKEAPIGNDEDPRQPSLMLGSQNA
jgi:putative two-component system response regulator